MQNYASLCNSFLSGGSFHDIHAMAAIQKDSFLMQAGSPLVLSIHAQNCKLHFHLGMTYLHLEPASGIFQGMAVLVHWMAI
jgi:hypothetical protein